MRFYQKLIQNRKEGGGVYEAKRLALELYQKYPDNEFLKQEYRYWQKVYWLTGEVTRRLGIDAEESRRLHEWSQQKDTTPEEICLHDITLNVDHPVIFRLISGEYCDIFPTGMYYDRSGHWLSIPDFSQKEFNGEGPYETESVQLHNDDIVIDCGANMGVFSILAVKRGAKTVYAFDPQERALKLLNKNITSNNCEEKIIPVPYGLSDKKCTLSFVENNENIGGSRISREGDAATTTIECTTIDDWVAENNIPRIDFIKADIEGAERDMLRGAANTIRRDHPRLAICTYHLPDDPEVLRDIILSIDPSYHIDQRAKKLYAW
ncbi:MAG: FkbM family methyltransferase [Methanocorpusculum sp.]|nr:FkbM family methyltransferase [Methanocorpusculum sp.]